MKADARRALPSCSQIPMLFYAQINALAWCLERVWILLGRPGRERFQGGRGEGTMMSKAGGRGKME